MRAFAGLFLLTLRVGMRLRPMINADARIAVCTSCGWKEPTANAICSQCGKPRDGAEPPPPPAADSTRTFSLRTLFLGMTVISVWVALTVRLPILGAVLGMLGVPAFFRAAGCKRGAAHLRIDWDRMDTVSAFFRSLVLMWAFAVLGLILFGPLALLCVFLVEMVSQGSRYSTTIGMVLAGCIGLGIMVKIVVATWDGLRGDRWPYL